MFNRHKPRPERVTHDSIMEVYKPDGKTLAWSGKLVDFSTGGLCFTTDRELKQGEHLSARIRIFGEGLMEVAGTVAWTRLEGARRLYGLKFDSVTNHGELR
ncbi:MAG TPA: hypothetical protein DCZ92_08325 [Elusimicrobia bacterium]|nr:MAG: hypothetical protein A2016_09715 [Elusimicrobia bacterium GWF2_62_30]HBA60810.1 hypothetical protein [Elusimicrobiota bacterium]